MKNFCVCLVLLIFALKLKVATAQQISFHRITKKNADVLYYTGIAQDKEGFIWIAAYLNPGNPAILYRYDGTSFTSYRHDPRNPNSLQNYIPNTIITDKNDKIWIGFTGGGMDRFDPFTGKFTHFRHLEKAPQSLSSDTVNVLLQDHLGNIWAGTNNGLNLINAESGNCTHYLHRDNDPKSISSNIVDALYEDREGRIWVGCGGRYNPATEKFSGKGGLNLFNREAGNFTSFFHDPANPFSLANNFISCIYEDSRGRFWVGAMGNALHILDRKTGKFTYYPHSPDPSQLSSPPTGREPIADIITFIKEDALGRLWIGTNTAGLTVYDPKAKKSTHYGSYFQDKKVIYKDTAGSFENFGVIRALMSAKSMFWFSTAIPAAVYNVNFNKTGIPFVKMNANANAFYQEPGGNVLWIGTNKGLIRKDLANKTEKMWSKDSPNNSGWAHDTIGNMTADKNGILWIATLGGGLCRFDPAANKASYYLHDPKNTNSISSNLARNLLIDHNNNAWIGTWGAGMDMLDIKSHRFTHFVNSPKDSLSLSNNTVDYLYEDKDKTIWEGTFAGIDRLNKDGKTFRIYLKRTVILNIFADKSGTMWAGTGSGLYRYDQRRDNFYPFIDAQTGQPLGEILDIQEDSGQNLWLRANDAIVKVNAARTSDTIYGDAWGVNTNSIWICRSLKGKNGELFFGTLGGYQDFFPGQVKGSAPPLINITSFKLTDTSGQDQSNLLFPPGSRSIALTHHQNSFSLGFIALHYDMPGEEKYQVMLQNYDHGWRDLNTDHKIDYFYIPSGSYILHIKAFNADGVWGQKDIKISISPPWWQTWWAYVLMVLIVTGAVWGFVEYRSRSLVAQNKSLEQKVHHRTEQLQRSLEELRSTQKQLIQSEKMASLGELTAGIAHEIQNPLNFVNNFSEVSVELIDEMDGELDKEEIAEAKAIGAVLKQNLEKIRHHGKRADAIVKGMLEHSRVGTGEKQPTDLNALSDEFLKLSYHGLRAKDKDFNAELITQFDEALPKANVSQQDIGRVLLNLFNNAFYAVNEKKKTARADYKPEVNVTTFAEKNNIIIKVKDNGNGIPDAIKDKIMQPFFTTKPTGEGTGLGLSLSYDIVVKGHRGSISVNTIVGESSEFTIILPTQ